MVETAHNPVSVDTRSEEERLFDSLCFSYADIPDPVPEKDNPDALFANGWGRRGHFALLVAPSGVGKSVISTQLFVPWTMGKPGLVGSAPLIPLRVSVIQAEDDITEMGEFRRDHRLGHLAEGWTMDEIRAGEKPVYDMSQFFRGKVGEDFIAGLDFALRRHPCDVVVLNPLQSYAGIDLNKNSELSAFLRKQLDPILVRQRTFMLCVHHTNKPNNDRSKGGAWGSDDLSAYIGAGGAELTNYARSVTFIRRCTPKECAIENSFMLVGAKRGNRLGWKDFDGKKTNKRIIAYSPDYIHWRVPTKEEIDAASGSAASKPSGAPPLSPEEAAAEIAAVIRADWPQKGVYKFCRNNLCSRMTRQDFTAGWQHFTLNHKSFGLKQIWDGNNSYHFVADPDAAAQDLPLGPADFSPQSSDDPEDPDHYWNK